VSTPFFITGPPRIRSAWFSVITRTERSMCLHEPTADYRSWGDLKAWWTDPAPGYRGIADSGLGLMMGRIINEVCPRILIIDRSMEDVQDSLGRYLKPMGLEGLAWSMQPRLEALRSVLSVYSRDKLVRVVNYEELDSVHVIAECLDWLMPMVAVPRLREMMSFNIQRNLGYMVERSGSSTQWWLPEELRTAA
jgi:hypothetical protein